MRVSNFHLVQYERQFYFDYTKFVFIDKMALKIVNELKLESDPCVLAWDNKLFVACEDGTISSVDGKLNKIKSWQAHGVQIFGLTAGAGNIYSTSNDGGVRVWSYEGEKIKELPETGSDIGILRLYGNKLFAGDELGNVTVFTNDVQSARYILMEEVKDLEYRPPFLFTVRDLDVTVIEISPDESKNRFTMRHSMEGRAPLRCIGSYLLMITRDGNTIRLHDASPETSFKKLHEVKASEMIITSLAVSGDYAWSGGWDGIVRRWHLSSDQLQAAGEIVLGSCINALVSITSDIAFVALAGGRVVQLAIS